MSGAEREEGGQGRPQLTIRLSVRGHEILAELARRQGISRTAILELLLRQEAERVGQTGRPD